MKVRKLNESMKKVVSDSGYTLLQDDKDNSLSINQSSKSYGDIDACELTITEDNEVVVTELYVGDTKKLPLSSDNLYSLSKATKDAASACEAFNDWIKEYSEE